MIQPCPSYVNCPEGPNAPLLGYDADNAPMFYFGPNLVVNGTWSTGDLTGWTVGGSSSGTSINTNPIYPYSVFNYPGQSFGLIFHGASGTATLTQTVATIPGQPVFLQFYWRMVSATSDTGSVLTASINGTTLFTVTAPGLLSSWNFVRLEMQPATASTVIQFTASCVQIGDSFSLALISSQQVFESPVIPTPQPFVGTGFGPLTPPPLNWTYDRPTAFADATSLISQAAADQLAFTAAVAQAQDGWTDPGPTHGLGRENPVYEDASDIFVGQEGAPNTPPLQ